MLIPLLSLALAVVSPAPAQTQPVVSAARLDQIERLSSNWQTYKAKSGRAWGAIDSYGNTPQWHKSLRDVWLLAESIEGQEQEIMAEALKLVRAQTADPALLASRESALRLLRQVRMLRVYGDIVPRILDEAIEDAQGRPDGRRFAGSSWEQVLTDEEGQAASKRIRSQIGIPADEFDALNKRVRDQYNAEHPRP